MQRPASDLLRHAREAEHLLVAAGRTQHLPIASREVGDTLARLRAAELARTAEGGGFVETTPRTQTSTAGPLGAADDGRGPLKATIGEPSANGLATAIETTVDLRLQQVRYQAAPGATSRVVEPGLPDLPR